jgi:hypothetical protein
MITSPGIKLYYLTGFGSYTYQLLSLFSEPLQSDYLAMISHHLATMALMLLSYVSGFYRFLLLYPISLNCSFLITSYVRVFVCQDWSHSASDSRCERSVHGNSETVPIHETPTCTSSTTPLFKIMQRHSKYIQIVRTYVDCRRALPRLCICFHVYAQLPLPSLHSHVHPLVS